jgi:hypothetical protein
MAQRTDIYTRHTALITRPIEQNKDKTIRLIVPRQHMGTAGAIQKSKLNDLQLPLSVAGIVSKEKQHDPGSRMHEKALASQ